MHSSYNPKTDGSRATFDTYPVWVCRRFACVKTIYHPALLCPFCNAPMMGPYGSDEIVNVLFTKQADKQKGDMIIL
jgi:hypothetical protein